MTFKVGPEVLPEYGRQALKAVPVEPRLTLGQVVDDEVSHRLTLQVVPIYQLRWR
ncbi:hypothetical protein OHB49_43835 (plasmid) [Streptomyces sp. NBC_01717]|uniref:hypothetical protein n=1 Tax=Streptomyces sp. NBC_01717 TaxID=2975918 RepID=UPI002E3546BE|nr:hypothetical protein [Streptomyces sp. NBC_01717]